MAIARLSLLLVAAIARQYTLTSPNARPPPGELRELRGAERRIPAFIAGIKILWWFPAFLEGLVLFALSGHCPPIIAHPLLHSLLPTSLSSDFATFKPTSLTVITPTFLAGILVTLTGTLLRGYCYHTLGKRFTYELSIRPSHTLVTDGVYGVVRHPSYAAMLAVTVGWLLCLSDRQGPVVAVCVGWLQSLGGNENEALTGVLTCVWVSMLGFICLMAHKRMTKEDAMLEENFGQEWRAWAARVPYRLVPLIY